MDSNDGQELVNIKESVSTTFALDLISTKTFALSAYGNIKKTSDSFANATCESMFLQKGDKRPVCNEDATSNETLEQSAKYFYNHAPHIHSETFG